MTRGEMLRTRCLVAGGDSHWFNMSSLLDVMAADMEPDMDTFSCSMAIDIMEAYHKVSSPPPPHFQLFPTLANTRQGRAEYISRRG
jgi:hypothetical protein